MNHLDPLLTHADTLTLNGWTKQALSQAVRAAWDDTDPLGWAAASWLVSPQVKHLYATATHRCCRINVAHGAPSCGANGTAHVRGPHS